MKNSMILDYFYGQAGELFSFYRVPKALFQEPRFQSLSTDAKTLYGILLDRMSLSVKNGWLDEQNRVFILFTIPDHAHRRIKAPQRMLNQANGDRQILAKQLNISPHQLSYVTHSGEGEGLLFFGNVILPFVDRFPTDLELYRIMTTKLGEVSEGAQK